MLFHALYSSLFFPSNLTNLYPLTTSSKPLSKKLFSFHLHCFFPSSLFLSLFTSMPLSIYRLLSLPLLSRSLSAVVFSKRRCWERREGEEKGRESRGEQVGVALATASWLLATCSVGLTRDERERYREKDRGMGREVWRGMARERPRERGRERGREGGRDRWKERVIERKGEREGEAERGMGR